MITYLKKIRILVTLLVTGYGLLVTGSYANAQSVSLTSPNGGECLEVSTAWTVTWSMSDVHHADVYYSLTGNEADKVRAVHAITGQTSYTWIVPAADITVARMFIYGHDAAESVLASDASDGVFSIQPACTAPSPTPTPAPIADSTGGGYSGALNPIAPANLSASFGDAAESSLELQWTDNSVNELEFRVFLRRLGDAWPTDAAYTLSAGTAFTSVAVPAARGSYEYRVDACNTNGCAASNAAPIVVGIPTIRVSGKVRSESQGVRAFVSAWSNAGGYTQTESAADGAYALHLAEDETWHISTRRLDGGILYRSSEASLAAESLTTGFDLFLFGDKALPQPISVTVEPNVSNTVSLRDGLRITIPAGAVSATDRVTVAIAVDAQVAHTGGVSLIGNVYAVEMAAADGTALTAFETNVIVSLPYADADIASVGAVPEALAIAYWDEPAFTWVKLVTTEVDREARLVSAAVDHLTRFVLVAPADTLPPDPPYGVSVEKVSGGFSISWLNPAFDFHHAKIYRSAGIGILGNVVANNLKSAPYTDVFTSEPGAVYYYVVRAVDLAGNESANVVQYSSAGPSMVPGPKETAPQAIPSFPNSGEPSEALPESPESEKRIPAYQKYPNGTLVATDDDEGLWIIMNGYRRRIVDRRILGFYGHLQGASITHVSGEELAQYGPAAWVRYAGDPKVYEVNDDATRHWLDMSAADFTETGRRWDAVFIINNDELNLYMPGANVTRMR
ncbi:MAG: hypothetical protein Q8Q39_00240 [bacterium]|nr:hypothetical protein [bacterium]